MVDKTKMWRVLLVVIIACSKTRQLAPQVATEPWRLATYAPGGAVMHLGVKLAFVAADGAVRWRTALASTAELESLRVDGDALVATDEQRVRALDLATGRERWHRAAVFEHIRFGVGSIALENRGQVELVSLASGRTVYAAARPSQWLSTDDTGFLFGGDDAVWAIGGATGRERWRQAIDTPGWIRYTPTTAIVHAAHDAWWELDLASGRVVGRGVIAAPAGEYVFSDSLGDRFLRIGLKTMRARIRAASCAGACRSRRTVHGSNASSPTRRRVASRSSIAWGSRRT